MLFSSSTEFTLLRSILLLDVSSSRNFTSCRDSKLSPIVLLVGFYRFCHQINPPDIVTPAPSALCLLLITVP
ncbi:hypothetical protein BJ165DRAFT_1516543 [Panaeolus papilionaceus]|nr:hypothetical protein BJ165DRAFT_1516543 [Panaeolus papilionaceus]